MISAPPRAATTVMTDSERFSLRGTQIQGCSSERGDHLEASAQAPAPALLCATQQGDDPAPPMDRTSGLLGQSLHRIMDLIGRGRLLDSGCSLGVFAKR